MLYIFYFGLCPKFATCRNPLTIHNPLCPNFPEYPITFILSRHLKSSLTTLTGFMSSINFANKEFPLLGVLLLMTIFHLFRSLQLTCDSPKNLKNCFRYAAFSFFTARFSHNCHPDVLFQSLNLMLPIWGWKIDQEIVEIVPLCRTLMDQSWQKVHLIFTQLDIYTFTSSTRPNSFSSLRYQSRWPHTWSKLFVLKNPKQWSLHRNWNTDRPRVTKVVLFQTYLEVSTRPYQKLQPLILASGSEMTLSCYYRALTLENLQFFSLHWPEFFHQDLHRHLFSLKKSFLLLKSNLVCSIEHFCVALTENIAVQLRFLFYCCCWFIIHKKVRMKIIINLHNFFEPTQEIKNFLS